MRKIPTSRAADCTVQKYIGSAYDEVKLVADNIEDIKALAAISDILHEIGPLAPDLAAVIAIQDDIKEVVAIADDVTAVATLHAEIALIAPGMESIIKCANEMAAIKSAPAYAQLAGISATEAKTARDAAVVAKDAAKVSEGLAQTAVTNAEHEATRAEIAAIAAGAAKTEAATKATESEASAVKSEEFAQKSEDIYEAFAKGAVYRGGWNPGKVPQGYPDPGTPKVNSYWDVYLSEGTSEVVWNEITWYGGDRLIYSVPDNKYFHIGRTGASSGGVLSVNGKTGAVIITAGDLKTYTKLEIDALLATAGKVESVNGQTGVVTIGLADLTGTLDLERHKDTTHLILRHSDEVGEEPLPADIDAGEVYLNTADKKLYAKNRANEIITIGGDSSGGSGVGIPPPIVVDVADAQMEAGKFYLADTSNHGVELHLPHASAHEIVYLGNLEGSCSLRNPILVSPNTTQKIHKKNEPLVLTQSNISLVLMYINDAIGWKVIDGIGEDSGINDLPYEEVVIIPFSKDGPGGASVITLPVGYKWSDFERVEWGGEAGSTWTQSNIIPKEQLQEASWWSIIRQGGDTANIFVTLTNTGGNVADPTRQAACSPSTAQAGAGIKWMKGYTKYKPSFSLKPQETVLWVGSQSTGNVTITNPLETFDAFRIEGTASAVWSSQVVAQSEYLAVPVGSGIFGPKFDIHWAGILKPTKGATTVALTGSGTRGISRIVGITYP